MARLTCIILCAFALVPTLTTASWAKREADDVRRQCRESLQKSSGQGKDAKVSRKALDRCVESGGPR